MLFTPVIVLLKWIPLIGMFLAGAATLASFLFALVVGVLMSLIVISVSWLVYRPFLALSLLSVSALGIYLIFNVK